MRALALGFGTMMLVTVTGLADTFDDAQKAFKDKKYKQAVKLLDAHLKDNKDDAKAYLLRGQANANTKAYDVAMVDFTRVIELDPKSAPAHYARGKLFVIDKKADKAMADFDKAIELSPTLGAVYIDRGNLHLSAGAPDKATADFDKAVKFSPTAGTAFLGRARATLVKHGQPVQFERDGKTYVVLRPTAEGAKKALPDLDKAVELSAKSAASFATRAECYEVLGTDDKAVADRIQAAALNKTDAYNLNRLAWTLATSRDDKLRDGKAAVEYAGRAVELSKGADGTHLDTLAAAHAEAGDFKKAVANQEKAIEVLKAPERSPFHERLELYKRDKPYRVPAPPK